MKVFGNIINLAVGSSAGDVSPVARLSVTHLVILLSVIILVLIVFGVIIFLQRKRYRLHAYNLENTDLLTGVRNRKCFLYDAEKILFKHGHKNYSIMQINIRNFKYINEVFGTKEGDRLIKCLAKSIAKVLMPGEIQARFTADNFVILLRRNDLNQLLNFFKELRIIIKRNSTLSLDENIGEIYCGIYTLNDCEAINIFDFVNCALIALRVAGEKKTSCVVYDEDMRSNALRESEIIDTMKEALSNDEFCFYLQPQYYLMKHDEIMSAEALVRWKKPNGTIVLPGSFISIFEKNGFVIELDRYIFEKVCEFVASSLNEDWFEGMRVAVNVSRIDIYKSDFVEFYTKTKNKYHIPDKRLELEFTESAAFEDYQTFQRIIHTLKANGFYCSLDDFGSGHSSLNVLKELPVDTLKMDRKFFIGDKENLRRNNSLIASVIAMGRGLDMEIVAEGIEDEEQIEFLRKIGCGIVQGYVYSKPLCVADFIEYAKSFRGYDKIEESEKIETSSTAQLQSPGIDDVYMKYSSLLKNTEQMVWETDLRRDTVKIVSNGNNKFAHMGKSGIFSREIQAFAETQLLPEDRFEFLKTIAADNIMACFERGDKTITHEYRAKVFDSRLLCLKEEYANYTITVAKIGKSQESSRLALIYFKYADKPMELQQNLKLAFSNLSGAFYELNIKNHKIVLVQNNSLDDPFVKEGDLDATLTFFFRKHIHPEDAETVRQLMSPESLGVFRKSASEVTHFEYRKECFGGVYQWHRATLIKNNIESDVFLLLVQKI
ncbi:MAG: EAL domain-containing protein [Oscillospiraceae bacterium]|nr:EAL domain-containing protein [Oscillospiraceae bacterium]